MDTATIYIYNFFLTLFYRCVNCFDLGIAEADVLKNLGQWLNVSMTYLNRRWICRYFNQVYSNTRDQTKVNTNQHESTRIKTSLTRINTSPTRINTIMTQVNTTPTRVSTNQSESGMSQHESYVSQHESTPVQNRSRPDYSQNLRPIKKWIIIF